VRNRVQPAQLVVASEHERAEHAGLDLQVAEPSRHLPASPRHAAQLQNVLALDTWMQRTATETFPVYTPARIGCAAEIGEAGFAFRPASCPGPGGVQCPALMPDSSGHRDNGCPPGGPEILEEQCDRGYM
jgi:hypothetical protein